VNCRALRAVTAAGWALFASMTGAQQGSIVDRTAEEIKAAREAEREAATELLVGTVSGIWVVRDAAVQVLAITAAAGPCRKEWRRLAARATETLWPYVADWSAATAETTVAAVGDKVAAAVADIVAEEADVEEGLGELRQRYGLPLEERLAALEDRATADLASALAEDLASGLDDLISEVIGCVERGGLTWEEWVEAEAAGKAPANPPAEQGEAVERVRKSGLIA